MFRKRWVRRVLITIVVSLTVYFGYDQLDRYLTRRAGAERYAEIVAHLDATDPRWRYDEIDADRGQIPDDQNGALLIPKFKAVMAKPSFVMDKRLEGANTADIPPGFVLDDDTYNAIDEILAANAEALTVARRFADYPRGLRRYAITPNVLDTKFHDLQETRAACRLLDLAAERAGRDGRGGVALGYVRPMVNAARSIDGEPSVINALVRLGCLRMAATRVERTLGLATPRAHLAEIQAQLTREADADLFWYAVRGDRAMIDRLFVNLRSGDITFDTLTGRIGGDGLGARMAGWAFAPHLPGDHATFLDLTTRAYEARSLPEPDQRAALAQVERDIQALPRKDLGSALTRALTPSFANAHTHSLRTRARLRCAVVGLAVEQFRLTHGRWPANLAEIPRTLLPAIPMDPFIGLDLRYTKRSDVVTVYSVGPDGQDDGGTFLSGKETNDPGQDVVFRLYDPIRRGLPAEQKPGSLSVWADPAELDRFDGAPPESGPEPREVEEK